MIVPVRCGEESQLWARGLYLVPALLLSGSVSPGNWPSLGLSLQGWPQGFLALKISLLHMGVVQLKGYDVWDLLQNRKWVGCQ